MQDKSRFLFRRAAFCAAALALIAAGVPPSAAVAAPAAPVVGVVEFYAISPAGGLNMFSPERFAADNLSAMLARTGAGRITVIPRATVRQAEGALGWHGDDALRFARLGALARQLNAGRLVVGWIKTFSVGMESGEFPGGGGGMPEAYADLVVQVFEASQGRIVWRTESTADTMGIVAYKVGEEALSRALQPVVSPTIDALTSQAR